MIFVSRYLLSLRDCRELRLTDTYSLHRAVYSLFRDVRNGDPGSSGILFADKGSLRGLRRLLVLSDRAPLEPEYGRLETRELQPAFLEFPHYRFECVVNPVRKSTASGKREPVRGRPAVASWFMDRACGWGFQVDAAALQVADITVDVFRKGSGNVTLGKARLSGILTVADREGFIRSVKHGIGHGKAFGCGLLQIVPLGCRPFSF